MASTENQPNAPRRRSRRIQFNSPDSEPVKSKVESKGAEEDDKTPSRGRKKKNIDTQIENKASKRQREDKADASFVECKEQITCDTSKRGRGRPRKLLQQCASGKQVRHAQTRKKVNPQVKSKAGTPSPTWNKQRDNFPRRKKKKPSRLIENQTKETPPSPVKEHVNVPRRRTQCSDKSVSKLDEANFSKEIEVWRDTITREGYGRCPLCMCRRKFLDSILNHYKKCKQHLDVNGKLMCSKCEASFRSVCALKYHMNKHSTDNPSEDSSDGKELTEQQKIRQLFKIQSRVKCPQPNCMHTFATPYGYTYHVDRCGVDPAEAKKFFCLQCPDKVYTSKAGLSFHQKTVHEGKQTPQINQGHTLGRRKAAQRALNRVKLLTADAEDNGEERKEKRAYFKERESKSQDDNFSPDTSGESEKDEYDESDDADTLSRWTHFPRSKLLNASLNIDRLENTVKDQRSGRLCSQEEGLFSGLRSTMATWPRMSSREAAMYEPVGEKADDNDVSLPIYGTAHRPQPPDGSLAHHEMNCGGPVVAMAWCPLPLDQPEGKQYAAITSYRSKGHTQNAFSTQEGPGLIQLWACGDLQSQSECPQMCLGIAHDAGSIRALAWCPSGCWEDPQRPLSDVSECRLGLLAAASSRGCVLVYSISHPTHLQTPAVYKPAPNLILGVKSEEGNQDSCFGPCLCIEWLPHKPHSKIAVGFSSGSIAIWNVEKECALLREACGDGSILLSACQVIPAHGCLVQSLQWSLADSFIICSTGRDKVIHFWDLRWPSCPLSSCQMAHTTCGSQWAPHWNGALTAHYTPVPKIILQDAASSPSNMFPVCSRKFSLLDMKYSEWLNSVAVADIAGSVSVLALPLKLRTHSKSKYDIQEIVVKVQEGDGLHILSNFLTSPHAISKVEWNPNHGVHRWLLCGGQSGTVRLCYIPVRDKR